MTHRPSALFSTVYITIYFPSRFPFFKPFGHSFFYMIFHSYRSYHPTFFKCDRSQLNILFLKIVAEESNLYGILDTEAGTCFKFLTLTLKRNAWVQLKIPFK